MGLWQIEQELFAAINKKRSHKLKGAQSKNLVRHQKTIKI